MECVSRDTVFRPVEWGIAAAKINVRSILAGFGVIFVDDFPSGPIIAYFLVGIVEDCELRHRDYLRCKSSCSFL